MRAPLLILAVVALAACRRDADRPAHSAAQALWQPAAPLSGPRAQHTATLLPNGKVLVAGGFDDLSGLATAELYDPATDAWSPAASMAIKRYSHQAILLQNGKVLVVGGAGLASAELYSPANNNWTSAGSMVIGRTSATATLLNDGRVLVAGGYGATAAAELYDPATNGWTMTPSTGPRFFATATLLSSGSVLVAGGAVAGTAVATAEVYDPVANTWTAVANLTTARSQHAASLLPGGKVLVTGGNTGASQTSAEVYDPTTNGWLGTPALSTARSLHTSTRLVSGKILVTSDTTTADLYDPVTNTWASAGTLLVARSRHAAVLLPSGKVLLTGGLTFAAAQAWAELFEPTTGGTACTDAGTCPLGFCVDGLCCDSDCSGPCNSCDLPSSPGVCTVNPKRSTGAPVCAPYACAGTDAGCPGSCLINEDCAVGSFCEAGACLPLVARGGICTLNNQCITGTCANSRCCTTACAGACDTCGATGACFLVPAGSPGSPSCSPFVCGGTAAGCPTSCTSDLTCATTHACDGGQCLPRAANGTPCTTAAQCASRICTDGVCCDTSCSGNCDACNRPGSAGTCTYLDAGATVFVCIPYVCPGNSSSCLFRCSSDPECNPSYRCADAGFCTLRDGPGLPCTSGSQCVSNNCSDGVCCETPCTGGCDFCGNTPDAGKGKCQVRPQGFVGAPSCSPYICQGAKECPTTCARDSECSVTHFCLDGGCTEKTPTGTPCFAAGNCVSGSCSDGVCCDSACAGGCDVCNRPGSVGTCALLAEGAPSTCAPYVCGAAGKCRGTCTTDAHCVSPNFCSRGFCTTTAVVPPPPAPTGCGCQAGGASPLLLLLVVAGLRQRRRNSSRPRLAS